MRYFLFPKHLNRHTFLSQNFKYLCRTSYLSNFLVYMSDILILNATMVNEGEVKPADVWVKNGRIEQIGRNLSHLSAHKVIDATGLHLMAGCIDDQVHFREPGLTHKATIASEAHAAVAGGVTSFMEMPNTQPATLTQELLEQKYQTAAAGSLANYSFFMGASNDNLAEVLKTNPENVCGIKVFMGSSTGNMLVDNAQTLEQLFAASPMLIATHCEDEATIRRHLQHYQDAATEPLTAKYHPIIRDTEACWLSSSLAVDLAKKHGTRLHILHISTAKELALFNNQLPLSQKKITAEVCVHHLWFSSEDYDTLGNLIKCNPAIKEASNREALWLALADDRLDIVATDHAPHTLAEKQQPYLQAPSGLPLVQHSLLMMLEASQQGRISLARVVEKMAHAPAQCFNVRERGFIREGYWADLVLVDLNKPYTVGTDNTYYQCGWSPLQGHTFSASVRHTIVSGHLAYSDGTFDMSQTGKRLLFDRV